MLLRAVGSDRRIGDKWSERATRSGPSVVRLVPGGQAARPRMAPRVANHAHSADIARPKTRVAVSTSVAWTTAPRAGTESGINVMSPRLVTDETRPRCEG